MGQSIYKYKLQVETMQDIELPKGAKILSSAVKGDDIFIWVRVDTTQEDKEYHSIMVYGTGHDVDPSADLRFIDTVFMRDLVFHVFEVK